MLPAPHFLIRTHCSSNSSEKWPEFEYARGRSLWPHENYDNKNNSVLKCIKTRQGLYLMPYPLTALSAHPKLERPSLEKLSV
jgi:hypothetical protein